MPTLIDRRPYNVWEEKRDGARDWARQKAQEILKTYHPSGIDEGQYRELSQIISSVQKS